MRHHRPACCARHPTSTIKPHLTTQATNWVGRQSHVSEAQWMPMSPGRRHLDQRLGHLIDHSTTSPRRRTHCERDRVELNFNPTSPLRRASAPRRSRSTVSVQELVHYLGERYKVGRRSSTSGPATSGGDNYGCAKSLRAELAAFSTRVQTLQAARGKANPQLVGKAPR